MGQFSTWDYQLQSITTDIIILNLSLSGGYVLNWRSVKKSQAWTSMWNRQMHKERTNLERWFSGGFLVPASTLLSSCRGNQTTEGRNHSAVTWIVLLWRPNTEIKRCTTSAQRLLWVLQATAPWPPSIHKTTGFAGGLYCFSAVVWRSLCLHWGLFTRNSINTPQLF